MSLQGSIIAIVTPMCPDGALDLARFEQLIQWQIQQGCDGIVVAGSTGEAATLTTDEKKILFATAKEMIADRVPLIAGTGTNCTRSTIELSKAANDLGVQYTLLTCPYYNKPTQKGLFLHYQAVSEALPQMQHILYSIPGRSIIQIEIATVVELSKLSNIVGVKDSGSSKERIRELRARCGPNFSLLSGDDEFTLDCMQSGGDGVISVVANAFPAQMHALVHAALEGNVTLAAQWNQQLMPMYQHLFCQSNPIPLKALLHHMGKIETGIRLPLTWLDAQYETALINACNFINGNKND